MKKIAILNQKGGVGKTTTSINLAYGLAATGRRTLIIDLDAQGHVAIGLGQAKGEEVYELFCSPIPVEDLILEVRDEIPLHIIPGSRKTEDANKEIVNKPFRERILSKRLKEIEIYYDYVIFDCSPTFGVLNQNALIAADEVIVPIGMDFFSAAGLMDIETSLHELELDPDETITGIVPTFFDVRNKNTHEMFAYLKEKFKDKVTNPIRVNTKISKAQAKGVSIFEYDESSAGAKDYFELVRWVVNRE